MWVNTFILRLRSGPAVLPLMITNKYMMQMALEYENKIINYVQSNPIY